MGLLVEYGSISFKLDELLELIRKIKKEVEHLKQVVSDLGIFWESDASGKFAINIYGDLYNVELTIEALHVIVNSMITKLTNMNDTEYKVKTIIEEV